MQILILGGAGFLGCHLVRRCLADNRNRVTVVDSLDPRLQSTRDTLSEIWSRIQFIEGDLRDARLMAEVVQEQAIVFNCAAQTSHPLSMSDPLFDASINCLGNLTLLEALRVHNPTAIVVYPSSSTVIGRATDGVIDEEEVERPLDIYSANKGVAEKYYQIYHTAHGLKTVILRFANLYGPYGKGSPEFGFVNYFISLASEGQDITVYGDGAQTRNLLYIEDAANILYQSAFNPQLIGKILFATHEEHRSVREIATMIMEVFGSGQVRFVEWPHLRKRIDVDHVRISSAQLYQLTDWRPQYSFAEGLLRTKAIIEKAGQLV